MDPGVIFVVHVWRDARGWHATARDVRLEQVDEFNDLPALTRFLAASVDAAGTTAPPPPDQPIEEDEAQS